MGNICGNRGLEKLKPYVPFPNAIDGYVQGGDLIFIEELDYFDGYTRLNTQTLHHFKRSLRLKQDTNDFLDVKQWSRMGIIVDSDIDALKYVLELTRNGFVKTDYITKVLELKANNQTFAIKRLKEPLNP